MPDYTVLIMSVLMIVLLIVLIVRVNGLYSDDKDLEALERLSDKLEQNNDAVRNITAGFEAQSRNSQAQTQGIINTVTNSLRSNREEQAAGIANFEKTQRESFKILREEMAAASDRQTKIIMGMQKSVSDSLLNMQKQTNKTLQTSIAAMTESNEKKLDEIRGVVNEKLDKTLNERLDSNFKLVGEQMANLYRSLGELRQLSAGVTNLNRTISNVKTRGNWGEVQLGRILEQTLAPGQYDTNVVTKKGSADRVEYAVRLPRDREDGNDLCLLPIDAKFPSDIYNRIAEAADNADETALREARSELKERIRNEAGKISDKYLDPPNTSDYAIMYLPTEGLYAEALSINGLSEECQKKHIMIAGPTTIMALLNTISVGFRQMAINQKSEEIRKILEATKAQIDRLEKAADDAQKKMDTAYKATSEIQNRTRIMRKKMKGIASIDSEEADRILGIEADSYDPAGED